MLTFRVKFSFQSICKLSKFTMTFFIFIRTVIPDLSKNKDFLENFQENETFCESFGFKHTTANNQEIKFKFGICSSPSNSRSNPT